MENTPNYQDPAWFEPMRRYVPLAVWIIVLATVLFIPLKVLQYRTTPCARLARP
jgi:hypothetical protein